MLSIRTNNASQSTVNSAIENNRSIEQTVGQLTTGKRVNSGKDDAAAISQLQRINSEIEALRVATRNAADAQSLLDTLDTTYETVTNILLKMRELAVQAANGTYQQADREIMTEEMKQLEAEIIAIGLGTSWADLNLTERQYPDPIHDNTLFMGRWNADYSEFSMSPNITFQIGVKRNDTLDVVISMFGLDIGMGLSRSDVSLGDAFELQNYYDFDTGAYQRLALTNINTASLAMYKIDAVDKALSLVATRRGKFAATNNRLDNLIANLSNVRSNLAVSKGRIEDADVAATTTAMAKHQILQQAAVAILSQANDIKTPLLGLIQDKGRR